MNPNEVTTPDVEIDPYTGKLKSKELQQQAFVQTGFNRNLIYTKAEVDAKIAAGGGGGGGGAVSSVFTRTGAVTAQTGDYTAAQVSAMNNLVPTAVKTGNYSAAANDFVPIDTTSGNVAVTLPTAPADKTLVGIKMITQGGTNTVTVNTSGSDVYNKVSGPTSLTLTLSSQATLLQYNTALAVWYIINDNIPLSQIDLRYLLKTTYDPAGIAQQVAGTTATQALTNKDLTSGTNTFPTFNQNTTGSAAKLTTARNIAGVAFDGSAAINLTSGSSILKGDGAGGFANATGGTDYQKALVVTNTNAPGATPTIATVANARNYIDLTGLAVAITSMTTNLSGTPARGDTLWISFTDNGTARGITWGSSFEASTIGLPTTTVISTRLDVGLIWNVVTSKWRCVAVV